MKITSTMRVETENVPPAFRNVAGGLLGGAAEALTAEQDNQSRPARRVMANCSIFCSLPSRSAAFNVLIKRIPKQMLRVWMTGSTKMVYLIDSGAQTGTDEDMPDDDADEAS